MTSFKVCGDEDWDTDFKVEVNNLLFQSEEVKYFDSLEKSLEFIKTNVADRFLKLSIKKSVGEMKLISIRILPDFENDDSFLVERSSTGAVSCLFKDLVQTIKLALEK